MSLNEIIIPGMSQEELHAPLPEPEPTRMLPLSWLTCDGRCQPRVRLDQDTIQRYAEALEAGGEFPAIEVVQCDDGVRLIVDGWHRFRAHEQVGRDEILCHVIKGTRRDALWIALQANAKHGLHRSHEDLKRAIDLALDDPEWAKLSDRKLAEHIDCDHKTIGNHRRRRLQALKPAPAPKPAPRDESILARGMDDLKKVAVDASKATRFDPELAKGALSIVPERCAFTMDIEELASEQAEYTNDDWYTPPSVIRLVCEAFEGPIDLDPASCAEAQENVRAVTYWTKEDDALTRDWKEAGARTVWFNPPYSRELLGPMIEKFIAEYHAGAFRTGIVLVNAYLNSAWFHDLGQIASTFAIPKGRLSFYRGGEPQPGARSHQILIHVGHGEHDFERVFGGAGYMIARVPWL